jgi:hypothetical protein
VNCSNDHSFVALFEYTLITAVVELPDVTAMVTVVDDSVPSHTR